MDHALLHQTHNITNEFAMVLREYPPPFNCLQRKMRRNQSRGGCLQKTWRTRLQWGTEIICVQMVDEEEYSTTRKNFDFIT